ncbi:N-acetylmuramoyl-L-alanine amidase [Nakamurella antarctica]|uniref:N-acetylmuramoyl-L-alanine amidase n=1 Tax=Nakamurella antarctica TaxID=1902245 RepID=UPI0019D114F0|nr:N-acetylmuramoyl-L-alanine amidase [Nakamurella antarctica]
MTTTTTVTPAPAAPPAPPKPTPAPSKTPEAPPPISTPATPVANGQVSGKVVLIDPGHNGANGANPSTINALVDAGFGETKPCNTTGTQTNDGYAEHSFTWSVANSLKAQLEAQGVTVVMTRSSDDGVGPCVNVRAAKGNDAKADAVISIHGDGSSEGDRGFYVMTSERAPAGSDMAALSLNLAGTVRDALVNNGSSPANYLGSNGLWKRSDLAGLNLSVRPTVMLEMGNMRDSKDSALMKSAEGRQQFATGIGNGVLAYLAAH